MRVPLESATQPFMRLKASIHGQNRASEKARANSLTCIEIVHTLADKYLYRG